MGLRPITVKHFKQQCQIDMRQFSRQTTRIEVSHAAPKYARIFTIDRSSHK